MADRRTTAKDDNDILFPLMSLWLHLWKANAFISYTSEAATWWVLVTTSHWRLSVGLSFTFSSGIPCQTSCLYLLQNVHSNCQRT